MIEKLIDIGDCRLFSRHMGHGKHTIICENAMGNTLKNWWPVQTQLAQDNYVITYDRGGIGKSDKGTCKRNASNMAKELHTMLEKLQLTPPYVLIGASYGCFIIRAFAYLYPEQIEGGVFVEPSHEDFFSTLKVRHREAYEEYEALWKLTAQLSNDGYRNEWSNYNRDCDYMRTLDFPTSFPLCVISSMRWGERERLLMRLEKEDVDMRCQLHKDWLRHSNVKHIVTDKSGHNVLDEEPELVIKTIRQLLHDMDQMEIDKGEGCVS